MTRTFGVYALLVAVCLGMPGVLFAQFSPPGFENALSLTSAVSDLSSTDITWFVDGNVQEGSSGSRTMSFQSGSVGRASAVSVVVKGAEGTAEANARIIPAEVDLLFEANSFTPPFYAGRAHASAGSTVTLWAIPRLVQPGGSTIQADQVIYTWRRNGDILGSLSGRGKRSITLPAPLLFGSDSISVEATSADKAVGAESTVGVTTRDPELALYREGPRYGVLYEQAFAATSIVNDQEAVFVVVPYFAPTRRSADPLLRYQWRINRTAVQGDGTEPDKITIDAANSTGIALIELVLTHATNYFLEASGRWNITFERESDLFSPLIPTPGSAF